MNNERERILDICTIDELAKKYGNNNWRTCLELGKQEKEVCELMDVETWSDKGWTPILRVIRHKLASHKKMFRILTHTGLVDVTDDHSLLLKNGSEISPKEIKIGTELLHYPLLEKVEQNMNIIVEPYLFDNMIYAAKYTNYLNSINKHYILTTSEDNITVIPSDVHVGDAIKKMHEINYEGYVYDLTTENHHFAAGIGNLIVHNTDSVFFKFNLTDKVTQQQITGDKALELSIEIAKEACHNVSKFLKQPHDFEYEKTFMPFCLLSKKRYVGILYESDPKVGKRKEMGIVLKRRDNAPIVKDVYGGAIDILMKEQNIQKAIEFVQKCLQDLVDGRVPMEKLIISKSLRSFYKKPDQIAHKVLADRMGARDPGNKPGPGDRIPFVYIVNNKKGEKVLQGNKIETPDYIRENNLKIDYSHYITNQIMKPLLQLFGLVLDDMWKMKGKVAQVLAFKREIEKVKKTLTEPKKIEDKITKMKNAEVQKLVFDKYLRETKNMREGNSTMMQFVSNNK